MSENMTFLQAMFEKDSTVEQCIGQLQELKEMGFREVLGTYRTTGRKPVKFNDDYFAGLVTFARACRETDMRFWLEDYAPFPTGSASGAYTEPENQEKGKCFLDEHHCDLSGPLPGAVISVENLLRCFYGANFQKFPRPNPFGRKLLCVVAARVEESSGNPAKVCLVEGSLKLLTDQVKDGFLKWDVPEGRWRVFVVYTTPESTGRPDYMNLLSRESVALEMEHVHKPIWEHLKEYVGKEWLGFFYDEPEIGNSGGDGIFDYVMLPGRRTENPADFDTLPWAPELPAQLLARDDDWLDKLPYLFYEAAEGAAAFRVAYMDAVTSLVRENYNGQVYAWCREKGIGYIGHVLEDENSHGRLGCGDGHYFREQYFQDEAGVDVIASQLLPGRDGPCAWYGTENADGEFYHYMLAKLASSEGHINPLKNGKSFTECFALFGKCGFKDRKFLMDHLFVSGISRLLIMERSADESRLTQIEQLTAYAGWMGNLIRSGRAVMKTAVLYHAEAEWFDAKTAQSSQKPAAILAQNQISYDIVPADVFAFPERYAADLSDGLTVNGNHYEALVIPGGRYVPEAVAQFVRNSRQSGFPVFVTERVPDALQGEMEAVPLSELAKAVLAAIDPDIRVAYAGNAEKESAEPVDGCQVSESAQAPADGSKKEEKTANECEPPVRKKWLRVLHLERAGQDIFLLHNESPVAASGKLEVLLKTDGTAVGFDPVTQDNYAVRQQRAEDGFLHVELEPGQYEMVILVCEKAGAKECVTEKPYTGSWKLALPDGGLVETKDTPKPQELPVPESYLPYGFYGDLVYASEFWTEDALPCAIDLGQVSDFCEVFVNGKSCGMRLGSPYRFNLSGAVQPGKNSLEVRLTTAETLHGDSRKMGPFPLDVLTAVPYQVLVPMGIRGPVRLLFS